ncbi:cation diffusion facilitator family transporter [Allosphingosinicella vermicomposti]|uniref:cation diffusion facilitator family transporter n=1 Tax=Allosphingosinicella vermicomposti TaxID=614671 RepID=UPI000D0F0DB6|nr:cation diffusion facilitator family transporter [Allosphingosinicella vermicomposti]
MTRPIPPEIEPDLRRAIRLEWWTLAWLASIVAVMGLTAGSSQAMRTAWIEDMLSMVPAIVFLIALHFEHRPPTRRFPFGFKRVNSLAFLISAVALSAVGASLLIESTMTLLSKDHATIPPVTLFGNSLWSGWLMVAALVYSVVPPFILGRLKLPVARRLQDKVLHTDAMMQKADWMTGLAGVAGVIGLGFGYWWADALAAALISVSILQDGLNALRVATAELVDGAPRKLENADIADDAALLRNALAVRFPGADVRLREMGRFIHAEVRAEAPATLPDLETLWPGPPERRWRLAQLSFVPPPGEES